MNPSSLPVLGVESEKVRGYFTILTLSIYIYQKKMGRMYKDPGRIPRRKIPDYCLMSRPRVDVATWIPFICSSSVATRFLQLRPGFLQLRCLAVATSIVVATFLAQLFSRVDVVTLVSRRNLVVVPFCYNSESRLQFFAVLHVATSVLGCDHISVSTASPHILTFFFRLQPPFLSSALICSEFRLRPQ